MTPKLTYFGRVESGKLILTNRARFDQELPLFEGKRVEITVQKAKRKRTSAQNRYRWGCVYHCARTALIDSGNIPATFTLEDVHEICKDLFITEGREFVNPLTGEVRILKSTKEFTTTEDAAYTDEIIKMCAFLGVVVPEPLEQTEMKL